MQPKSIILFFYGYILFFRRHFLKENFSENKFIFGSNYPVAKITPAKWAKLIIESKIFDDLDKIFYKNALLIYKGG